MSNSYELARIGEKKISHQLDVHHVESRNQTFLCSGCRIESKSHELPRIRRKENFSSTRRTSCLESRNQTFMCSGCGIESNSHELARISEKKISHELDVHHV